MAPSSAREVELCSHLRTFASELYRNNQGHFQHHAGWKTFGRQNHLARSDQNRVGDKTRAYTLGTCRSFLLNSEERLATGFAAAFL